MPMTAHLASMQLSDFKATIISFLIVTAKEICLKDTQDGLQPLNFHSHDYIAEIPRVKQIKPGQKTVDISI
jgi:hypothetical protein